MIPTLDEVIKAAKLHPSRVFNVTIFGSRVYGNINKNSDWDIIIVANNSVESTEIRSGLFNIHVYTPNKFEDDLNWHKITNLECVFAPEWAKLKESIKYKLKIDNNKLRHSIQHTSFKSWSRCEKKITEDYYISIKSLFHSIRIPMFAKQIAEHGKIINFNCANDLYNDLMLIEKPHYMRVKFKWTWKDIIKKYKKIREQTLFEFMELNKE